MQGANNFVVAVNGFYDHPFNPYLLELTNWYPVTKLRVDDHLYTWVMFLYPTGNIQAYRPACFVVNNRYIRQIGGVCFNQRYPVLAFSYNDKPAFCKTMISASRYRSW